MIKNILKSISVFLITLFLCVSALFLVCKIPQSAIHENSVKSSEYFSSHAKYPTVINGWNSTIIDNYADCMLLDVIYNVDEENAFYSIIAAPYYRTENGTADEDYAASVIEGKEPNDEYSRYWHGSQIFVRPLLTIMSINGIRLTPFCLFAFLNLWLAVLLIRRRLIAPAALYFVSLLLTDGWMTAFSLEYIMPFLVMTAACIALCLILNRCPSGNDLACRDRHLCNLFLVSGTVTCFLDFLTTETLTFTIPFLLFLLIDRHKQPLTAKNHASSFRLDLKRLITWGCAWAGSYVAAFLAKWFLIYLTVGKSAFLNALQNAAFRIEGTAGINASDPSAPLTSAQRILSALVLNLSCLFHTSRSLTVGSILGISIGIVILLACILYLFRGERLDAGFVGILLIIACIPYLRYIVLSNHASMHFFFTYRAQMACIMALLGIMTYQLKPSYILPKGRKHAKKSVKKDSFRNKIKP